MTEALSLFERLGAYVLTWSWQVAVLVIVAWIAVRLDRRHRPRLRHSLWVSTLLFGLLLPWLPEKIAAQSWTREIRQVLVEPKAASSKPFVETSGGVSSVSQRAIRTAQTPGVSHVGRIATSAGTFSRATLLQAAGFLWMVGVVIAACRRMREYLRLRRIASNAAAGADESTPPIRQSAEVRSPMLFGWFRPIILLPGDVATWSTPIERATMVRHESVHYARKDHWVAGFESLVRTVFFFHPLVRWTCRQVDIERELVCDEEVLRGGVEPEIYAEAILKVAEHAYAGKASCGVYFSGAGQLDRRVDLLFRTPRRASRLAVLLLPMFLLLTPVVCLGFWQARVEALTPIEFRIQVNPIGLIPQEILAPPPVPIAAVIPRAVLPQDPTVNPVAPAPPLAPRMNVAFTKITEEQVMVNVTLGLPHSRFTFKEESPERYLKAAGRIEGQVTNLTGKVIVPIEETFEIMMLPQNSNPSAVAVLQKTLYLKPGLYRMFILISDSNSGNTGTIDTRLEVKGFPSDKLSTSSLILADLVEPVPLGTVSSNFRIGSLRVRPNMSELGRDQDLNIFQQVYVSATEAGSTLPVSMETLITLDGREVRRVSEQLQRSADLWGMAITKKISLADFPPGTYSIQTSYTDAATGERVVSTGEFTVR